MELFVRDWRQSRGISQVELARRIGTQQPHISFIETGRRKPRLSTVARLAKALEVSPDELSRQPDCPAA